MKNVLFLNENPEHVIVVPIVDSSGILCEECRVYILFTCYWRDEFVEICMRPWGH